MDILSGIYHQGTGDRCVNHLSYPHQTHTQHLRSQTQQLGGKFPSPRSKAFSSLGSQASGRVYFITGMSMISVSRLYPLRTPWKSTTLMWWDGIFPEESIAIRLHKGKNGAFLCEAGRNVSYLR